MFTIQWDFKILVMTCNSSEIGYLFVDEYAFLDLEEK